MFERLKRLWSSSVPPPKILDHLPVSNDNGISRKRLKAAAKRYGKPFVAAAAGIPHIVIGSKYADQNGKVTQITRKKAAKP